MSRAHVIEAEPDLDTIFQLQASADPVGDVQRFIEKFVILPPKASLPLSVWVAATYLCDPFDCFPYIAVISPLKRCGKTRLLEVLELVTHAPWRGTAPSPPALYRMMEDRPTLLLDEVEALNKTSTSEVQQALLSILNAGHRRGASIPRCDGPAHKLRHFPVYGPKAFAAIRTLPDTLLDRSIVITMQRRLPSQKPARLLWKKAKKEAEGITQSLDNFAAEKSGAVEAAYEQLMETDLPWLSDRDADLWMPLYALCSVAAPSRLSELQDASKRLSCTKVEADEDDSLTLKLLADLREIWPVQEERIETSTLIARLKQIDESPWGEQDFKFSGRKLAGMLRPFGVRPIKYEHGKRGYEQKAIHAAIDRYLVSQYATSATSMETNQL